MRLPDPRHSYAILIGTSTYQSPDLDDLPSVRNNLDDLACALTDPSLGGFPAEHCITLHEPSDARTISNELLRCARRATDTLLVYYAGHGLAGLRSSELYLALPSTDPDNLWFTALRYDDLRQMFLDSGQFRAATRVIILDCCYSGRAIPRTMSNDRLRGMIDIEGVCVLTATGASRRALAPVGKKHTTFTGEFIELLRAGIPGGPELLTLNVLYGRIRQNLAARSLPLPERINKDNAADLALVRNAAHEVIGHVSLSTSWTSEQIDALAAQSPWARTKGLLRKIISTPRAPKHIEKIGGSESNVKGQPQTRNAITGILTKRDPQDPSHSVTVTPRRVDGIPSASGSSEHSSSTSMPSSATHPGRQSATSEHTPVAKPDRSDVASSTRRTMRPFARRRTRTQAPRRRTVAAFALILTSTAAVFAPTPPQSSIHISSSPPTTAGSSAGAASPSTRRPSTTGIILDGHNGAVRDLAFSPDGKMLATGSSDSTIQLWDPATHQQIGDLRQTGEGIEHVAFSPDGKTLATGSGSGIIRLWDPATHQQIGELHTPHIDGLSGMVFSPKGNLVTSGGGELSSNAANTIRMWNTTTKIQVGEPLAINDVFDMALSPDSRTLATIGASDQKVQLWDIETRRHISELKATGGDGTEWAPWRGVSFSPDGRTVAVGGAWQDGIATIRLWDVSTYQQIGEPLAGHTDSIRSLAYSPDGKILASVGQDKTIRLWDVSTHRQIGPALTGHTDDITNVAFSPTERMLATASADKTVRLWTLP